MEDTDMNYVKVATKVEGIGYMVGDQLHMFNFESGTRFEVSIPHINLRCLDLCITVYNLVTITITITITPTIIKVYTFIH